RDSTPTTRPTERRDEGSSVRAIAVSFRPVPAGAAPPASPAPRGVARDRSVSFHRTDSRPSVFFEATLYTRRVHRTSFKDMRCSIAQCLEAVGEWWSLLIVRDVFRGIPRFADLESDLGISRNVLNQRLTRLVEQGI